MDQPQFLKFNISVQRDALVGVYGRKGLPPSHTQVPHSWIYVFAFVSSLGQTLEKQHTEALLTITG